MADASAGGTGTARANANATGGAGGEADSSFPGAGIGTGGNGGVSTATANALATGGGTAIAKAVATGGVGGTAPVSGATGAANATSTAETAKGALAQAQATALGSSGQAQSTATTNLAGVRVQSSAAAPIGLSGGTATTNAIAQGGSGQAFGNPGQTAYAFSTALPDNAYASTLIGGASQVASALLGPHDAVLGTAILGANDAPDAAGASNTYSASSTFDFADRGDLELGLIDNQENGFADELGFQSMEFTIAADGVDILDVTFRSLAGADSFFHDDVIDVGYDFGANIDLTFGYTLIADGSGGFAFDFALGGANLQPIPEPSTWAMMLVGLSGFGLMGWRRRTAGSAKADANLR
jgi:hypothetical protein